MNSCSKGKRGEREWARYLSERGFSARRGRQFSGSPESPDVVCAVLPYHWEVKRVEKLSLYEAMKQATRDSGQDKVPIVAHRKNSEDWVVILRAEDFLKLLKEKNGV